jgi:hypothetical protein
MPSRTLTSLFFPLVSAAVLGCGNAHINDELCTAAAEHAAMCSGTAPVDSEDSACHSDPRANCIAGCSLSLSCSDLPLAEGRCSEDCVCAGDDDCYTPLVLSFDGAPVRFSPGREVFDLGTGASAVTDWPTSATPWLALDRNGNGLIDDGSELFGAATRLRDGGRAANGFAALRELDSNGDGWITAADEAWPRLVVWSDRDADRVSSPEEIVPLSRAGVVAIALRATRPWRCDARGNCEGERATLVSRSPEGDERVGEVVDVYLRIRHD